MKIENLDRYKIIEINMNLDFMDYSYKVMNELNDGVILSNSTLVNRGLLAI